MSDGHEHGLQDLHISVQETILSYLDNRSLGRVALTCHSIRAVAILWARKLQVPGHVSGEELQSWAPRLSRAFPQAHHLSLSGPYSTLSPDDIRMFLLSALPASYPSRSPASPTVLSSSSLEHGSRAGPAFASDGCHKEHEPSIQGLTFSGLDLPELPLYLSTLLQLPSRWSHLRSFSLHHTPLSCPLDCTEPTLLDQLLRQLYAFEGRPVPHITLLAQQVGDHEMRLSANILVTQKVFQAVAQLPNLKDLDVRSCYLHPHNLALAALSSCSALEKLTLQLPTSFPKITVHGLSRLPPNLRSLTLETSRPACTWIALAAATTPNPERPQLPACHIRAPTPPPPLPVSISQGSGSPALNPLSPLASSSLATPDGGSAPSAAPPVYNPSTGHVLYTGQSRQGGGASGRRGGLSHGQRDNGTLPAALPGGGVQGLWGGVGSLGHPSPAAAAAAAAAAAQLPGAAGGPLASVFGDMPVRELPGQGLPEFAGGVLQGLQLVSGCPPPPEPAPEPEEGEVRWEVDAGGRPPPKDPWDSPEALQEVDMLDAMLDQAPGLQDLEIIGAGQLHVRLLARYRQQVPTHNLRLVCHKHVDVRGLLRADSPGVAFSSRRPLASIPVSTAWPVNLHLTLKGLTLGELDDLVAAATGTDAGAAVASCQVPCPSCRAKLARGGEGQGQAGSNPGDGIKGHYDKEGDKQFSRPTSGRRRGGVADVDGHDRPCTSSSHKGKKSLHRGGAAERGGVCAVNPEKQGAAGVKRSLSSHTAAQHNVVRTSSATSSSAARRAAPAASSPSSCEMQDVECTCTCSGSANCCEGPFEPRTSVHPPACRLQTLCIEQSKEVSTREVAAAVARMHSVCHISLTACRHITDDIVPEVARLRRPIRLCVSNCRLVMPQRWGAAVATAREVPGCWLIGVRYAEGLGGKNEVEFA